MSAIRYYITFLSFFIATATVQAKSPVEQLIEKFLIPNKIEQFGVLSKIYMNRTPDQVKKVSQAKPKYCRNLGKPINQDTMRETYRLKLHDIFSQMNIRPEEYGIVHIGIVHCSGVNACVGPMNASMSCHHGIMPHEQDFFMHHNANKFEMGEGYQLLCSRDFFEQTSDDTKIGILSHEFSHLKCAHIEQRFAIFNEVDERDMFRLTPLVLRLSRLQEHEADLYGAIHGGLRACNGMISFFESVSSSQYDNDAFNTHPAAYKRISLLKEVQTDMIKHGFHPIVKATEAVANFFSRFSPGNYATL